VYRHYRSDIDTYLVHSDTCCL